MTGKLRHNVTLRRKALIARSLRCDINHDSTFTTVTKSGVKPASVTVVKVERVLTSHHKALIIKEKRRHVTL